jgi:hypothetical protein
LSELSCAVLGLYILEVRKQRASLGQGGKDGLDLFPKSNLGRLQAPPARFHANKADDPRRPVHVLGLQVRQIRL